MSLSSIPDGTGPIRTRAITIMGFSTRRATTTPMAKQIRQPPTSAFRGSEHLGAYAGHGNTGVVFDPVAFDAVIRAPSGVLGPHGGSVVVDLVEAGYEPKADPEFPMRQTFSRNPHPSVVITVVRSGQVPPVLRWPDDFVAS